MDACPQSPLLPVGVGRTVSGHAAQASESGLTSLPSYLAQSILLAAVPSYDQAQLTLDNACILTPFQELASVSKQWRILALDAASNIALSKFIASVSGSKRKDLVELRRQLTLQRKFLLTLDIRRLPVRDTIPVDLLSCAPQLQEVKLDSLICTTQGELGATVRAIGLQCTSLQSLVISAAHKHNFSGPTPGEATRIKLSEPMYYAMERVYENTSRVGLHRLCVCMRYDLQGLESTRKYINHVLRFCPNLELFDGYRAAVFAMDSRICYEQWFMDLDLWTRFCSTLQNLTEFDWVCVPFATRFFEIFGQYAKPRMKALTFTTALNWKWNAFMRDVGPGIQQQLSETGFAGSAANTLAALRACPYLTELNSRWPPATDLMNPQTFGDEFWAAAVELCPDLASLTLAPVHEDVASGNLSTFTDRSLRAIAKLPRLWYMQVDYPEVTGDGIFDLAVHHAYVNTNTIRHFHVYLGDWQHDETDTRFYDAVTTFLQRLLAAEAPLPCATQKVTMYIENLRKSPVELEWSETYLANFQRLVQQVRAKHPDALLNMFAHDCDGTSFSRIIAFVFDTDAQMTRGWMEDGDTKVSDSLWNRIDDTEDDYYEDDSDVDDDEHDEGDSDAFDDEDDDDEYGEDYYEEQQRPTE